MRQIKLQLASRVFQKKRKEVSRTKKMCGLLSAKHIGVLFDASLEHNYTVVSEFIKILQENKVKFKVLGYVGYKLIPHYCIPKLSFDYFTLKELNWMGIPFGSRVSDFIAEDFDMLIDLTTEDFFPMQYISGLSKAKFKVGRAGKNNSDFYDFMIDVPAGISIEEYMDLVINYVNIFSNEHE